MQVEYLVTSEEMKQYDANTIDTLGIPGMVLMERAALGAFSLIEEKFGEREKSGLHVLIMAGMGNNGGDGLALARLLSEAGYQVSVFCVGNPQHASEQWKKQKMILEHFHVKICDKMEEQEYTIMVDKVKAKEYVANIIGEEHIIPTLGVWDDPDDIDFDKLPDQFVLKCNHNSGIGLCICKDKSGRMCS